MRSAKYQNLNLGALEKLANELAKELTVGSVMALRGDLGAGKTTFAAMVIRALTQTEQSITSPTFNLVHTYDSLKGQIWHFDLYRLKNLEEAYETGIEDAFMSGISIIEWPEIAASILPSGTIEIHIAFAENEAFRNIEVLRR